MSVHGQVQVKNDSGNLRGGVGTTKGPHSLSATGFMNGIKGSGPGNVGATLNYEHSGGHAASLTGQHTRSFGDQIHAAGSATLVNTNDHKLTANAFTSKTMPKHGPAFSTHGGGVNYQFQDKVSAGASLQTTPKFKQSEFSANSSVNLHKTPNSSLDLNTSASRTTGPFQKGNWNKQATLTFRRDF